MADSSTELLKWIKRFDAVKQDFEQRHNRHVRMRSWIPPSVIVDCMPTGSLVCFLKAPTPCESEGAVLFGGVSLKLVSPINWPTMPASHMAIRQFSSSTDGSWNLLLDKAGVWWATECTIDFGEFEVPMRASTLGELSEFESEGWLRRKYQIDFDQFFYELLIEASAEKVAA
ncbi:MAG: hypothetical protein GEU28_06760 [Dehalococcoidia bacterium]|nr:hypothetical protein [Dehalococcoidia bacterium]